MRFFFNLKDIVTERRQNKERDLVPALFSPQMDWLELGQPKARSRETPLPESPPLNMGAENQAPR